MEIQLIKNRSNFTVFGTLIGKGRALKTLKRTVKISIISIIEGPFHCFHSKILIDFIVTRRVTMLICRNLNCKHPLNR